MAITSEVLGKLGGGADVEVTPVSIIDLKSGTSGPMHTVNVPSGETWLVAVLGYAQTTASGLNGYPQILIGDQKTAFKGAGGAAAMVTGTAEIRLRRNWSLSTDSFTGHVYTFKM